MSAAAPLETPPTKRSRAEVMPALKGKKPTLKRGVSRVVYPQVALTPPPLSTFEGSTPDGSAPEDESVLGRSISPTEAPMMSSMRPPVFSRNDSVSNYAAGLRLRPPGSFSLIDRLHAAEKTVESDILGSRPGPFPLANPTTVHSAFMGSLFAAVAPCSPIDCEFKTAAEVPSLSSLCSLVAAAKPFLIPFVFQV